MTCDVTTTLGYPATINTPEYADVIADAADTMGYTPVEESGSLGGEDFAYFLMEKPGAYFHVGMADPDRPITSSPHHNCSFQLDERGLGHCPGNGAGSVLKAHKTGWGIKRKSDTCNFFQI